MAIDIQTTTPPSASSGRSSLSSGWSRRGSAARPVTSGRFSRGNAAASGRTISTAGGTRSVAVVLPPSSDASVAATARSVRPATGLSRSHNNVPHRSTAGVAPVVETPAYYASLINSKIDEIAAEIERLRSETEMMDGESEPRRALDGRHRDLKETAKRLEDELADHSLAREHARLGVDHEDVRQLTNEIFQHNGKLVREIDGIFDARKRTEDDIAKVESEIARIHSKMEARIVEEGNGEDDAIHEDRIADYRMFVEEIEFAQNEATRSGEELFAIKHENRLAISAEDSRQREAKLLVEDLRQELVQTEEELMLAGMSEGDAREHLIRKMSKAEHQSVKIESESSTLRAELDELAQRKEELRSELRLKSLGQGSAGACERLARKGRFYLKYLEDAPSARAKLQQEKEGVRSRIDLIRRQLKESKRDDGTVVLPSREELELMKSDVAFATKNLDESRRTTSLLEGQTERRAAELDKLESLEARIEEELADLHGRIDLLNKEAQSTTKEHESRESRRRCLNEMSGKYMRRIEGLETALSEDADDGEDVTWEQLKQRKKIGELSERGKALLKLYEKGQDESLAENESNDHGQLRAECLELVDKINGRLLATMQTR